MTYTSMILWLISSASSVASLEVKTQYGPIDGTNVTLYNGQSVYAYLGVPYAAPPIGMNRFAPPQPPKPWNTTLDTKALPKSCFQFVKKDLKPLVWFISEAPESEDCLYLNIWRPKNNKTDSLPVMIWIHGGAYFIGSSNIPLCDGGILASQNDVIVITINYRLEFFGFLFLNTSDVPGNVGLLDQICAIKWVRENIANFGGDPERITLFGQSAGAISTSFHLLNTQIQDLFQYAIMQSGAVTISSFSLTKTEAYNRSLTKAKKLGCSKEAVDDILSCLRTKTAENLLKDVGGIDSVFSTNVLPVRNGVEVPFDVNTAAEKVPLIKRKNTLNGDVAKDLGYLTLAFFPQKPFTGNFTLTEADLRVLLANSLQLADSRLQSVVLHEYKNYSSSYDPGHFTEQIVDLVSDFSFICPAIDFTKSYTSVAKQAYYYYFTHRPSRSIRLHKLEYSAAVHGDEIPFVFGVPLDPANGYTEDEIKLSIQIMSFYKNFVRYGNPNGDNIRNGTWPQVEADGPLSSIVLDTPSRAENNLKERQCTFWASIYPQLISLQRQL